MENTYPGIKGRKASPVLSPTFSPLSQIYDFNADDIYAGECW